MTEKLFVFFYNEINITHHLKITEYHLKIPKILWCRIFVFVIFYFLFTPIKGFFQNTARMGGGVLIFGVLQYISLELCILSSRLRHNIFVSKMKSLQIQISKMKLVLITSCRSGFNFLQKQFQNKVKLRLKKDSKQFQTSCENMM